jgi:peptidyl-prolyl cis-trans isomerase SurA
MAQLAAAYSDAPDGMKGGNLGWRSLDRLPTMFAEASLKLKAGEVSPVLRSSNGFHLIKLLAKRGGGAAQAVEQTHARHILIKVNEVVSESEARHKLEGLQARIRHGEFAILGEQQAIDLRAAAFWRRPPPSACGAAPGGKGIAAVQGSPAARSTAGIHQRIRHSGDYCHETNLPHTCPCRRRSCRPCRCAAAV